MSNKHDETVDAVVDIIKDTLIEVVSALAVREKLKAELVSEVEDEKELAEAVQSRLIDISPAPASDETTADQVEDAIAKSIDPMPEPVLSASQKVKAEADRSTIENVQRTETGATQPEPTGPAISQPGIHPGPALAQTSAETTVSVEDSRFFDLIDATPEEMREYEPHEPEYVHQKLPTIHMHKTLWQVVVMFTALLIFVNVPILPPGIAIARVISDTNSLIVREGLIFKSATQDEVYVLDEDLNKRWIADIEAFHFYNISWDQVSIADDAFVAQFEEGEPVYVLVKCASRPHVYALEAGTKRWIEDIPTFEANGFVWEQIDLISCSSLDQIPDGLPIPEDAGSPGDG